MKKFLVLPAVLMPLFTFCQHDKHVEDATVKHGHLAHMQASRAQVFYIHNLPAPKLMTGIGNSKMKIETKSEKTQAYFNQGLSLLHDFWDFEAYRAFKEAIRNDSTAIMPYWGLLQTVGPDEDSVYKSTKTNAIGQLKKLLATATEHEKLYAEIALLTDSLKEKAYPEIGKKMELIIHKFPDDIDAKLFLALAKMSGFDTEMKPMEGQMYSEFLLKDVQRTEPNNHAFHHYWIHLMEHCCPEKALASADILTSLGPSSGHIVHMPGHIYNRVGNYKKAHDAFVDAVKTDSAYMKNEGIQEVDNWNYIHNINYLINNCVHDGRLTEGLYYAERLKNMPVNKHRKKVYDGTFFNQGLLAPAKMQMAFGNWDRAAQQFELVVDKDTVYSYTNMEYKNGLTFFVKGMDELVKNNVAEAEKYSNSLDALLWRNAKQTGKDSTLNEWYQNTVNTASLELQGCIASYQGNYNKAIKLLEKAEKQEIDLGYGEPPLYARPVAVSIADAQIKAEKYDKAIDTYNALLKRFPKSAFVYNCLRNVYLKKGKTDKAKEYEMLLKDAAMYADAGIYGNF
jgi:tetratricopeptide (TPR) repeat protein